MYRLVKTILQIGFFFFFKNIHSNNRERIPKKGAVLFIGNHPNALLDPLLVATQVKRDLHFITRASVFGNKILNAFFKSVQMLPIYRPRDGKENMHLNEKTFEQCYDILGKQGAVLIFVEGSHDIRKYVRPLKTGFARIALGALNKHKELEDIQIVPVGLNYTKPTAIFSQAQLNFGPSFSVKQCIENSNSELEQINALRIKSREALKQLSTHIDAEVHDYDRAYQSLLSQGHKFLEPLFYTEEYEIENLSEDEAAPELKSNTFSKLLYLLIQILSPIPMFIWRRNKSMVKQEEFVSTFKFAVMMGSGLINFIVALILGKYLLGNDYWIYITGLYLGLFALTKSPYFHTPDQ
ncbi:MAG: lysophospholipid acyltransferase family protein [Flavobacteriaceae bacterium]